jgi:methylmalonyl-CoA mutase
VFGAGVGGADALAVLPFTAARGLPDAFARRIARNTQLVLLHEANLAHVADPAAGTGWSEDLGDTLCRAAWSLFQEIEAAGGAPAALERGLIQGHVARARSEREQALANERDALIGATLFPAGERTPVEVLAAAPVTPRKPAIAVPIKALEQVRFAQPYEVHASRGKP